MSENKHTIAICAYGESSYLEECIRSVEQQGSRNTREDPCADKRQ